MTWILDDFCIHIKNICFGCFYTYQPCTCTIISIKSIDKFKISLPYTKHKYIFTNKFPLFTVIYQSMTEPCLISSFHIFFFLTICFLKVRSWRPTTIGPTPRNYILYQVFSNVNNELNQIEDDIKREANLEDEVVTIYDIFNIQQNKIYQRTSKRSMIDGGKWG